MGDEVSNGGPGAPGVGAATVFPSAGTLAGSAGAFQVAAPASASKHGLSVFPARGPSSGGASDEDEDDDARAALVQMQPLSAAISGASQPPTPTLPVPSAITPGLGLARLHPQRASEIAAAVAATGTDTTTMGQEFGMPAPERDTAPRPAVPAPQEMRRTRVIVIREPIVDRRLPELVPRLLRFADAASLRACLSVNRVFLAAAAGRLYRRLALFGASGPVLRRLLRVMAASADGTATVDYRTAVRSLELGDLVLDEPEVTPLQSWNVARELVRRLAPFLEHLYLDSDDPRFRDPDFVQPGTCGLGRPVVFPRLRSLAIAPGCLAFPDDFVYDLLRRCPKNALASIRLPGCVRSMSGTGYFLIAERGGTALNDLIITPPNSFPPPDMVVSGEFSSEYLVANATDPNNGGRRLAFIRPFGAVPTPGSPLASAVGLDDDGGDPLAPFSPMAAWDPDLLADGLQLIGRSCPNLRALDASGHTTGLRPGALEAVLRGCRDMEELDLPCGVTDATLHELLAAQPAKLWRLGLACSCHRSYAALSPSAATGAGGPKPASGTAAAGAPQDPLAVPCSFLTADVVVGGILGEALVERPGALVELPTHVLVDDGTRFLPTLALLQDLPGANLDMADTEAVFLEGVGVRALVPNAAMTSFVRFMPLSGAMDERPLCYLLQVDEARILLDCGWSDDFDPEALRGLARAAKHVDAVLLTHADLDHVGAYPYAVAKLGLAGAAAYATYPVRDLAPLCLHDALQSKRAAEEYAHFSAADIDAAFDRVIPLRFSQPIQLSGGRCKGITVTAYAAGHSLGGSLWKIKKDTDEIVYAVDFNHAKERHLSPTVLLADVLTRPTLLITDAYNALNVQTLKRGERDSLLFESIRQTASNHGTTLIPIESTTRSLELAYLLETYWAANSDISKLPVFLLTRQSKSTITEKLRVPLVGEELERHAKEEKRRKEEELAAAQATAAADEDSDMSDEEGAGGLAGLDARGMDFGGSLGRTGTQVFDFYVKDMQRNTGFFKQSRIFKMFPVSDHRRRIDDYGEVIDPSAYVNSDARLAAAQAEISEELPPLMKMEAKMEDEEEKAPHKYIVKPMNVEVRCRVQYIDFEGRSDGRSVKYLLPEVSPRKILLIHGTEEATNNLRDFCLSTDNITSEVFCPVLSKWMNVSSATEIYQMTLTDSLVSSLTFAKINDYELAYVAGLVHDAGQQQDATAGGARANRMDVDEPDVKAAPDDDNGAGQGTAPSAAAAAAAAPVLDVLPVEHRRAHRPTLVGDVRLSEFRRVLVGAGFEAEFVAGALVVNGGSVAVRRPAATSGAVSGAALNPASGGRLVLEGGLGPDYFRVRRLLYAEHAAV
ncbi:cleavage and polyadenylation specificity factor subunit 2 [Cladochytrium tenue]|nr:cleavage and polyadenylation specificity factor subunit 2 [Cladochytrium tenue]